MSGCDTAPAAGDLFAALWYYKRSTGSRMMLEGEAGAKGLGTAGYDKDYTGGGDLDNCIYPGDPDMGGTTAMWLRDLTVHDITTGNEQIMTLLDTMTLITTIDECSAWLTHAGSTILEDAATDACSNAATKKRHIHVIGYGLSDVSTPPYWIVKESFVGFGGSGIGKVKMYTGTNDKGVAGIQKGPFYSVKFGIVADVMTAASVALPATGDSCPGTLTPPTVSTTAVLVAAHTDTNATPVASLVDGYTGSQTDACKAVLAQNVADSAFHYT